MDIISYVHNLSGGNVGVWLGADVSQKFVESGGASGLPAFDPEPSLYFVKYGGDWGGMWGDDAAWRAIRATHENVIPYLYCLPQNVHDYARLDSQLKQIGYPLVAFDVEFEWQHEEQRLRMMLNELNTEQNPCAFVGLAWFGGYGGAEGLRDVLASYPSLLYCPMAYLSELSDVAALPAPPDNKGAATSALDYAERWLADIAPRDAYGVILDGASISSPDAVTWLSASPMPSVWHSGTIDPAAWAALPHTTPETTLTLSQADVDAVLTDLGQSLAWLADLDNRLSAAPDADALALVKAVEGALHAARKTLGGE